MSLSFKGGDPKGLRKFGWRAMLAVAVLVAVGVWLWSVYNTPKSGNQKVSGVVTTSQPAVAPSAPASVANVATAPASAPAKAEKPKKVAVEKPPKPAKQASAAHTAPATPVAPVATASSAPSAEEGFTLVKRYDQIFYTGKQKGWERPNAAPCRKHMGCTTAWGLGESGWSMEVRAGMANVIATESPKRMQIHKGDRFDFMASANSRGPWMERNVVAAWPEAARVEPASYWDYEHGDKLYRYVVPDICGNISGQTFRVVYDKVPVAMRPQPVAPLPSPVARPHLTVQDVDSILGMAPIGECN